MLGLDTNVLVRFLVADDPAQFERARRLIRSGSGKGEPAFISLLVLLETEWVLRSRYALDKTDISAALSGLVASAELQFEDEACVDQALFAWNDSNADFADCLIAARHRSLGCVATATFDDKAKRLAGFVAA
jgi:predicted nucleic-acid-binding protein